MFMNIQKGLLDVHELEQCKNPAGGSELQARMFMNIRFREHPRSDVRTFITAGAGVEMSRVCDVWRRAPGTSR